MYRSLKDIPAIDQGVSVTPVDLLFPEDQVDHHLYHLHPHRRPLSLRNPVLDASRSHSRLLEGGKRLQAGHLAGPGKRSRASPTGHSGRREQRRHSRAVPLHSFDRVHVALPCRAEEPTHPLHQEREDDGGHRDGAAFQEGRNRRSNCNRSSSQTFNRCFIELLRIIYEGSGDSARFTKLMASTLKLFGSVSIGM